LPHHRPADAVQQLAQRLRVAARGAQRELVELGVQARRPLCGHRFVPGTRGSTVAAVRRPWARDARRITSGVRIAVPFVVAVVGAVVHLPVLGE
jgi:hypothetical protein